MADIVDAAKKAAIQAINASKPVEVCFGTVVSASPLKVNIGQKFELTEKELILSRNVTDFETDISIGNTQNWYWTGKDFESSTLPVAHVHAVGKKTVIVHNSLIVGDKVILLRQQGGQKYIIWDRVGIL